MRMLITALAAKLQESVDFFSPTQLSTCLSSLSLLSNRDPEIDSRFEPESSWRKKKPRKPNSQGTIPPMEDITPVGKLLVAIACQMKRSRLGLGLGGSCGPVRQLILGERTGNQRSCNVAAWMWAPGEICRVRDSLSKES